MPYPEIEQLRGAQDQARALARTMRQMAEAAPLEPAILTMRAAAEGISVMSQQEDFNSQCAECANKVLEVLFAAPKPVAICVLPGILAAVMRTFDIRRDMVIAMVDSALEDIG